MKNIIKNIASVAFVLLAIVAIAPKTQASGAYWNNHPRDLRFIQSKVFLDPSNPGNYQDNTSGAQPGQVIAVRLYYHNTGTGPASNTTFTMTRPSGSSTVHTISGTLRADGTNTDTGSTTISLSSSQTLTYVPNSLRFYRYNQYSSATPVGGDGSEIFNGGLNVGTIPGMDSCPPTNDFCEQGVVAVAFRVGSDVVNNTYACNDGRDNDGDGRVDYGQDPGCDSPTDNDEYDYVNNLYCQVNSFYPTPSTVTSGGYTTLYWSTSNCDYVEIDGIRYNTNGSGSFGPLYTARNYELRAWRNNQSPISRTAYVGVNTIINNTYACNDGRDNDGDGLVDYPNDRGCDSYTDNDEYNQVSQTVSVTTLNPTNLTTNSGRINGFVVNNGGSSNVYFEWGTNENNLVNTTVNQPTTTNGSVTFFDTLRGLSTNTTYYYRAVAQANSGTYKGDIKSFRLVTTGGPLLPPVVITPQPPVVITTPTPVVESVTTDRGIVLGLGTNLVQLRYTNLNAFNTVNTGFTNLTQVNNSVQNICVDESATFTVEYRNISNIVLNNAILHIDIPKDVDFRSSSAGVFNKADNTVTVNVGVLNPDQTGSVTFTGIVLQSASNRDLLVVPATLSFETPNNGARETAIAYGLATTQNCLKERAALGGFAFGSGFFPNTLIGWLFLLLVLVALVYIVRRWYMLTPVKRVSRREKYYEDLDVPTAPYSH